MPKSSPLDRLWRSHLQQSTPPSSLASAAECRATGPPPGRSRIHCNNELSSIQPGCTGCLPGRTGQSALAGWQPWCRCASHSRPSLPWLGTGRNIRGWWLESSVEKGEVAGILPAENTAKHVLCCLLKPVSNSILKLLVPDKWCCLWPGLHKYCCAQLHNQLTTACSRFPSDGFFHKQLPHRGSFSSSRPPADGFSLPASNLDPPW